MPKTVLADSAVRSVQTSKLAIVGWTRERVLGLIDVAPRSVAAVADTDRALVMPVGVP